MLCFDESISVLSPKALRLFNVCGSLIRQTGFSDIQKTLGVSANAIVRSAKFGPWMTDHPVIDSNTGRAKVHAGGKTLFIRFADGSLTAE